MKRYGIIIKIVLFLSAVVWMYSCTPIEDRDSMGPLASPDQIQIDVTSTTPGGNQIVVKNNTPQYAGTWNLLIDKSIKTQDTIALPFLGKQTIAFTATTAGGLVTVTKDITISVIDHPLDTTWAVFAGSSIQGKTWVWANDIPTKFVYGNGQYLSDKAPAWWTNDSTALASWGVKNDKMTFDLNGAANFTLVTGNTSATDGLAAGTYKGMFKFDMTKTKLGSDNKPWSIGTLTFTGVTISRGFKPNEGKGLIYTFDILKLNQNEMVLSYPEASATPAGGTAWYWVFKRQGFKY